MNDLIGFQIISNSNHFNINGIIEMLYKLYNQPRRIHPLNLTLKMKLEIRDQIKGLIPKIKEFESKNIYVVWLAEFGNN